MKKVSPFVKFEIIPHLRCLLDLLQKSTAGHGNLKFVDKFQDMSKEFCCFTKRNVC